MKTELRDILEIDKWLRDHKDGAQDARKLIIEYVSELHERIRNLDMVNEHNVESIMRRYKD